MVSGALRFFAASLLCHATTYAAAALATTLMEGAVISAAMESVRQAHQRMGVERDVECR